jgi:hypothetical protein
MVVLDEIQVIIHCPPGLCDAEAAQVRSATTQSLLEWAEEISLAAMGRFMVTVEP